MPIGQPILTKYGRHPDPASYPTVRAPVHRNSTPINAEATTRHHIESMGYGHYMARNMIEES
uniref:Uncharacterized protein n=1 Tax=Romanomermis culicivorax TaxID=13658 RepID=A0A915I9R1_ROMCU